MKRDSYADFGLIIAIAVFLILIIKSLIFGFSWGSIIMLLLTIGYFIFSYLKNSDAKALKFGTNTYLAVCVLAFVAIFTFDQNARPKIHAFEGAAKDSIEEEEFVVVDKEVPQEIVPKDTLEDSDSVVDEIPLDSLMPAPMGTEHEEPIETKTEEI